MNSRWSCEIRRLRSTVPASGRLNRSFSSSWFFRRSNSSWCGRSRWNVGGVQWRPDQSFARLDIGGSRGLVLAARDGKGEQEEIDWVLYRERRGRRAMHGELQFLVRAAVSDVRLRGGKWKADRRFAGLPDWFGWALWPGLVNRQRGKERKDWEPIRTRTCTGAHSSGVGCTSYVHEPAKSMHVHVYGLDQKDFWRESKIWNELANQNQMQIRIKLFYQRPN